MKGERQVRNEELVASRVPAELVAGLRKLEEIEHLDRSTAVRRLLYAGLREWKMQHAATLYQENKVTLARAAEEAGISVREMMEYLRQKKVPMQYDAEDFEQDLKGIYARLGKRPGRKLARGRDTPSSTTSPWRRKTPPSSREDSG